MPQDLFDSLPSAIKLYHIFVFFTPEELARTKLVCKSWNENTKADYFIEFYTRKLTACINSVMQKDAGHEKVPNEIVTKIKAEISGYINLGVNPNNALLQVVKNQTSVIPQTTSADESINLAAWGIEIMTVLLNKNADPNVTDEKGLTPLMYSVNNLLRLILNLPINSEQFKFIYKNFRDQIFLLINKGADPFKTNGNGLNIFDHIDHALSQVKPGSIQYELIIKCYSDIFVCSSENRESQANCQLAPKLSSWGFDISWAKKILETAPSGNLVWIATDALNTVTDAVFRIKIASDLNKFKDIVQLLIEHGADPFAFILSSNQNQSRSQLPLLRMNLKPISVPLRDAYFPPFCAIWYLKSVILISKIEQQIQNCNAEIHHSIYQQRLLYLREKVKLTRENGAEKRKAPQDENNNNNTDDTDKGQHRSSRRRK